ncbi:MAG TPA: hypothetical protein VGD74_08685 [Vulgatibacter sp.]
MPLRLLFAMALASVLWGCADSKTCTVMGCVDSVQVSFEPALSAAGTYELVMEWEGEILACHATLPLEPGSERCESAGGDSTPHLGGLQIDRENGGPITGMWAAKAPASLSVTIRQDDQVIASRQLEPAYERFQPNGAECDGDYFCQSAHTTLELD